MAEVPFPGGARDGTVFFHEDKVCIYSGPLNTWECRKVVDPTDPNKPDDIFLFSTDVFIPTGFREHWQYQVDAKGIAFTVPFVRTQSEVNQAMLDMVLSIERSASAAPDLSGYATTQYVDQKVADINIPSAPDLSTYATIDYVNAAVGNIIVDNTAPDLSGYALVDHGHPAYITRDALNVELEKYSKLNYVDAKDDFLLSKIVDPSVFVTHQALEDRILASAPTDIITSAEFEERLQTVNSNVIDYVETRVSGLSIPDSPDLSNYTTRQDFTALTGTVTAAVNQVAAAVADKATKQDVSLAGTAVDAKFDMLRSAIRESTDFDTLKARLLAVLE